MKKYNKKLIKIENWNKTDKCKRMKIAKYIEKERGV